MKKLTLVACLVACGDDASPVPSDVAPSTIALTVPATLSPGEPLPIAWTVTDATATDRVELHVLGPGAPLAKTSAGYHFIGSAPASIYMGTIAADGSLAPSIVAVASPAASGQVAVQLPDLGDWRVVAKLVRGKSTVAIAEGTTWVAATGLHLDVSRTWAGSNDAVRARVRTKAPAEPHRLSAWLTLPDGSITSVPGFAQEYLPVAERAVPEETVLLAQSLGSLGTGRYLLTARLETLDGQERGSAGAVIQVCDEPGMIAGTIEGGAGAVQAVDLAAGRTASAEVAGDGTFMLDVPAGTWSVLGGGAAANVEVGCGTISTIGLATAPSARPAKLRHGPSEARAVRILVQGVPPTGSRVDADDINLAAENLAAEIKKVRPGLVGYTTADMERIAGFSQMQMELGDDAGSADLSDTLGAPHYVVRLEIRARSSGGFNVFMILIDAREAESVPGRSVILTLDELEQVFDQLPGAVETLIGDVDELRQRIDPTDNPLIRAWWAPQLAEAGNMLEGTITVLDAGTGQRVPDATLETTITELPEGKRILGTATTDAEGVARVTYTVPATNPPEWVMMNGTLVRGNGSRVVGGEALLTIQPNAAAMRVIKPVLRANGERTSVRMAVEGAASRFGTAVATGLSLVGPPRIQFDSAGRALFDIVTDSRTGPAKVEVELEPMKLQHAAPGVMLARAYVIKPLELTAFVEPRSNAIHDQILEVRGSVSLEGIPLSGVPVSVELIGAGQVNSSTFSRTDGGYSVFWRAPSSGTGTTMIKLTVVKDADITERFVEVTYEPACTNCPVAITGPQTIKRKGTALFLANQQVSWSASRGTITSDGVFTAPNLGGTTRITATPSTGQPVTVSVIEECVYNELFGGGGTVEYKGDVMPTFAWSDQVDTACLKVRLRLFDNGSMVGVAIVEHQQDCPTGALLPGSLNFVQPDLLSCSIGFQQSAPCGVVGSVFVSPDPNTDGMTKRTYRAFMSHFDPGLGNCVQDFGAVGVISIGGM